MLDAAFSLLRQELRQWARRYTPAEYYLGGVCEGIRFDIAPPRKALRRGRSALEHVRRQLNWADLRNRKGVEKVRAALETVEDALELYEAWMRLVVELARAFDTLHSALAAFTDEVTVAETRCHALAFNVRRGWHSDEAHLPKLAESALEATRALLDYQAERHGNRCAACERAYQAACEEVEVAQAALRLLRGEP